jgi:Rieske 2Fe-2S family protein
MNVETKPLANLPQMISAQVSGRALDQEFYQSEAIYRRDLERVFMHHWLCAGHIGSAPNPGDYFVVEIDRESIIIVRGQDGELRALANVCCHRGSRVCRDLAGSTKTFVCPYHGWVYGLDGALRGARHMPADFDLAGRGLHQIQLRVAAGLIFISFADAPLDFDRVAAHLEATHGPHGWATAKVAHRQMWNVSANWKLSVENYVECYHCAPAHPEYSELHTIEQPVEDIQPLYEALRARSAACGIAIPKVDDWQTSDDGVEAFSSSRYPLYEGCVTGSDGGGPVAPLMGIFRDYDGGATSTHFGPASFFLAYPDHGVIYRFIPRAVQSCDMEIIWLVRGDAQEGVDYDFDKLTWLWKVTTDADKRIIEDNQKGVNSRFYRPGLYAPMEAKVKRLIDWYLHEIS